MPGGVGAEIAGAFGLNKTGRKLITEISPEEAEQQDGRPQITEVSTQRTQGSADGARSEPFLPWIQPAAAAAGNVVHAEDPASSPKVSAQADFEAASSFKVAKPGFVYKLGGHGLGYYRDGSKTSLLPAAALDRGPVASTQPTTTAAAEPKKTLAYEVTKKGDKIVVAIHLPGKSNSKGTVLAVMGTAAYSDLTLRVDGFEELRARLPAPVNQQNVKAKFSKASQRLTVHLDIVDESAQPKHNRRSSATRRKTSSVKPQAPLKAKVNIDDLKICSQCGGLGQYTDAQDVKCGLQGQRSSGLQRVLTYECPTCEGEGYVNQRAKGAQGSKSDKTQAETQNDSWEIVDAGAPKVDAASLSAEDQATYTDFKNKMDPKKREEFERVLREARDAS